MFEKEYGKKKGNRIFYAWENKRGMKYPRKMGCNPKKELLLGMKVEKEHSHLFKPSERKRMTRRITQDHLKEDRCYYSKMRKVKGGLF